MTLSSNSMKSADQLNEEGLERFSAEEFQRALECFLSAAELNPSIPSFQKNIAETYFRLGNAEKAIIHYQKAIRLDGTRADYVNELGIILLFQEEYRLALKQFQKAVEINPEKIEYLENEAQALRKLKEYHQAIRKYKQVLKLNSQSEQTLTGLGGCFFVLKRFHESLPYFKEAMKINPQSHTNLENYADALRNAEDYTSAITLYEKILKSTPDDDQTWNYYGLSYLKRNEFVKDLAEAKKAFKKAIELKPENANYWLNLGNAYQVSTHYKSAISIYRKVKKLIPYNPNLENSIGMCYFYLKDFGRAREIFENIYKIYPSNLYVMENLIETYAKLNAYGSMKQKIQEILDKEEDIDYYSNLLGECYEKLAQPELAIHYYQQATELMPSNENYLLDFERYIEYQEYLKELEQKLKKNYIEEPRKFDNAYFMILFYFQTKKLDKADHLCLQALQNHPEDPSLQELQIMIQISKGKYEIAKNVQKKFFLENHSDGSRLLLKSIVNYFTGSFPLAREHLKKALNENPTIKSLIYQISDFANDAILEDIIYFLQKRMFPEIDYISENLLDLK